MKTNIKITSIIDAGINYLLSQQVKDFPEAVHYLTLPCRMPGGDYKYETHKTKLFQRMIILDALLDTIEFFDKGKVSKEIIKSEIIKILKSRHPLVEGGWSYIPDLLLLPPDADDLGLVLQLLSRTGGKELGSLCDKALEILFTYNVHPDGCFNTWIVDPNDHSDHAQKMAEYIEVVGGKGGSPEVVGNLIQGLLFYDKCKYKTQIAGAINYLIDQQCEQGYWNSKWYWGKHYSTFKVISVLSDIAPDNRSIILAYQYICNSQHNDGGWGEPKSDPLNTAFALLCLIKYTDRLDIINKGIRYLASTQLNDGSWERIPFIKMETEDDNITYESRTISTSFCIKALVTHFANARISRNISLNLNELPFEKINGELSVYSNEHGQWALVKNHNLIRRNLTPIKKEKIFCGKPGLHIIEISKRCNLSCTYCAPADEGNSFLKKQIDKENDNPINEKIAEFITENSGNTFCVEFQGGEPLINFKAIKYFVLKIKELSVPLNKKPRFRVVSNLLLLNDKIVNFIFQNNIEINTSLDGPEHLHNKNRISSGKINSYQKVIKGISLFHKHKINIGVLAVITKDSLDFPEEIIDQFYALGLKHFVLNPVTKVGNATKNWDKIGIDPIEYSYFWKKIVKRCFVYHEKNIPIWDRTLQLLIEKIILVQNPGFIDLNDPCGCVHGQIAYDLQGNIYPCDEARFSDKIIIGNVVQNTFDDLIHSKITRQLIEASNININNCQKCPYQPWCGRCPVKNKFQSGRFDVKSKLTVNCQLWGGIFDRFFELYDENPHQIRKVASFIKSGIF